MTRCPICTEPLDDTRPWQPDFDSAGGVHLDCLAAVYPTDEEDTDR